MLSVIPNPSRTTLPIQGSPDLFPVRRVYCVGRNYRRARRGSSGSGGAAASW